MSTLSQGLLNTCDHVDLADKLPLKSSRWGDLCEINSIPGCFRPTVPQSISAMKNESYVSTMFRLCWVIQFFAWDLP